ncbi:MAG: anion transporter [Dehalococcoidia bacterium]|nr:anion transporter [Dehalococcoidia bacterium]
MIALVVLTCVFILIAVRRIGRFRLQIWQVMSGGAVAVILAGEIAPLSALLSINMDVMLFLFAMFVVGQAMEESGYLSHVSYRIFRRARTPGALLVAIVFVMGAFSALLMNDTIAIIGTPVVLSFARRAGVRPQLLLMALAFSVTIGSVASPIGNPQNLLVAISGQVANPFVTFGRYLALPTLLSLLAALVVLRVAYRREFRALRVVQNDEPFRDAGLARLCRLSVTVLIGMLAVKVVLVFADVGFDFRLTYIALGAASPLLLFSRRRMDIVKRVDWTTLLFFAAMFVLMESVWESGYIQPAIIDSRLDVTSPGVVIALSVLASQVISNVPLTALYVPMLLGFDAPAASYMALAAGATIAGTFTILGAASNVIIIQNAEKRSGETLSFMEFIRAGLPLTLVCVGVYWLFLVPG